jgi:hypothetical protein
MLQVPTVMTVLVETDGARAFVQVPAVMAPQPTRQRPTLLDELMHLLLLGLRVLQTRKLCHHLRLASMCQGTCEVSKW